MAASRETTTALAAPGAGPEALYAKLSPGPGRSAEEVASHQRARIYGAMIEIAGGRGYDAVTVRELARLAGVSTRAFYEHFEGKEDCFLRAYEFVAREAAAGVLAAQKRECGWRERLRAGSLAYARGLERQPQAARLALVEAPTAGPAALERMRGAECMFEKLISESLADAPDGIAMPSLLVEGIAAGVEGVARARLLAGREHELPDLVDDLLEWALCYRNKAAVEVARFDGLSTSVPISKIDETSELDKANGQTLSDERERMLSAVAKLAAADDYRQLTVPRIRTEAGVSRRCFDAHFEGVGDCFLAALELRADRALAHAVREAAGSRTWAGGVHRAVFALCALAASDPVLARLAFVEVFAPGPNGMRCRERLLAKIIRLFRESAPPPQRPREICAEASVGAVWGIVHHRIVTGRARQLPRISPALSFLALAPAIGASSAADAIRADLAMSAEASSK